MLKIHIIIAVEHDKAIPGVGAHAMHADGVMGTVIGLSYRSTTKQPATATG